MRLLLFMSGIINYCMCWPIKYIFFGRCRTASFSEIVGGTFPTDGEREFKELSLYNAKESRIK